MPTMLLLPLMAVLFTAAPHGTAAAGAPHPITSTGLIAGGNTLSWTIRGINFPSWWHDQYLDQTSSDSLGQIAATGANWVAIIPTQYMDGPTSNTMAPENGGQGRTASDDAVVKAIDDAHACGLKVLLNPHIDISDGTSRWDIQPADPAVWFANYQQMEQHYASLAADHHVEMFSVGTELVSLTGQAYYDDWAGVTGAVRAVFDGPVTYAASTTEMDYLSFGDLLDYLGLDVYYSLSDNAEPTLDELVTGWTDYHGYYGDANWLAQIEHWQAQWNKPVIFTELGYRSIKYVALAPWDWSPAVYDGPNQANAYEAAFRVLGNQQWLAGVFWWEWQPGDTGGDGNTDYTVVNKPAANTLKAWYTVDRPEVKATVQSANWRSYADYLARNLTVNFNFLNIGLVSAQDVDVTECGATAGVQELTPLPLGIGTLAVGTSISGTVAYRVPEEVDRFRISMRVTYQDGSGRLYDDADALHLS